MNKLGTIDHVHRLHIGYLGCYINAVINILYQNTQIEVLQTDCRHKHIHLSFTFMLANKHAPGRSSTKLNFIFQTETIYILSLYILHALVFIILFCFTTSSQFSLNHHVRFIFDLTNP